MAFDDGTPLDAAKLQALETELNNVKASIPKIGSSTVKIDASTSNIDNRTIVQAQIAGGITTTPKILTAKGYSNETIPLNLTSNPLSVVVTPLKTSGSLRDVTWTILGVPTSNEVVVRVYNGYTKDQKCLFSWIAICGNK
jgi:hypothetical protein